MNTIKILTTSDIHSYIYPHDYADNQEKDMGLAKLSTLINSLRDENTLVLDNGDVLQGSPLSFYHYYKDADSIHPMTKAMEKIQYDYINVGNHDFNYGMDELEKHLNGLSAPCITSNVLYNDQPLGPTYVIRKMPNGKKIALFGLVTQYIPHFEMAEHIAGCTFLDAFETAKSTVALIKKLEKVDYIICIYHGGFERDVVTNTFTEADTGENEGSRICNEIEGIDVLITGHQHRSIEGKIRNTVVVQNAANGTELSYVEINCENNCITTALLHPDTEVNPAILDEEVENATQAWLDTTLGTTDMDLQIKDIDDARLHKHPVVSFLNQVQRDAGQSDLSAMALFLGATGFKKDITMRDIVSTYKFPNTVVVKEFSGKTLKEYLEKSAEFWSVKMDSIIVNPAYDWPKPQHYNYDMVDGVSYTIKVSNPVGQRILDLTYKGNPVKEEDTFTIAMNNYRASGGGNYLMVPPAKTTKEISEGMVELLADYIIQHTPVHVEHTDNIKVIV